MGENDIEGAKSELSSRMNEMVTTYRNGGSEVYTEAMNQHKKEETRRKRAEEREQERERKRKQELKAREKRHVVKRK